MVYELLDKGRENAKTTEELVRACNFTNKRDLTLQIATLFCKSRTYDSADKFNAQQVESGAVRVEDDEPKPSSFFMRYGVEKA